MWGAAAAVLSCRSGLECTARVESVLNRPTKERRRPVSSLVLIWFTARRTFVLDGFIRFSTRRTIKEGRAAAVSIDDGTMMLSSLPLERQEDAA